MRGNTPPTMRSPPHRSRPTGNPPNRQPATVGEEERGGRDPTSRRTSMRAAPDCRPPPTARHALQPRSSTSHPPQQQDAVHRELRPGTGKGASACAGPLRRAQDRCAAPHGRLRHPMVALSDPQRGYKGKSAWTIMSTWRVKSEVIVTMTGVTSNYFMGSRCVQRILDISPIATTTTGEIYSLPWHR
jgi:hypothetical protein